MTLELSSKYRTEMAFNLVGAQQGLGTWSGNIRCTWQRKNIKREVCLLEKWGKHFTYSFKNMMLMSWLSDRHIRHLTPLYTIELGDRGCLTGCIVNRQALRINSSMYCSSSDKASSVWNTEWNFSVGGTWCLVRTCFNWLGVFCVHYKNNGGCGLKSVQTHLDYRKF